MNLHNSMQKKAKKNQKQSFIKLQEHAAAFYFELEVVESIDCTQEMNDIVGNINMMETGYGNLTGMNQHLAKEKQHVYEEANKFYTMHHRKGNDEFGSMDFEEALNNHSMILPNGGGSFIINNKSMHNMGGSQIFNSDFHHPSMIMNPHGTQPNLQVPQPKHARLSSTANRSQMRKSTNFQPYHNTSMQMSNQNYFNQTMNSQVFGKTQGFPVRSSVMLPRNAYERRPTARASVLEQFSKLKTLNENMNHSMMSSRYSNQNRSRYEERDISIYTKKTVNALESNKVNI